MSINLSWKDYDMDDRFNRLAKVLCKHSTKIKRGDKVYLDMYDIPQDMILSLIEEVVACGGIPFVTLNNAIISRKLNLISTTEKLKIDGEDALNKIKRMDVYIGIRGSNNIYENSDIPVEKTKLISSAMKKALDWRVKETRWVVLRWPNSSMAQQACMSTESFENFYFDVCTMDYSRMSSGMKALVGLMNKTDKVRIIGNGTDLNFSIKNIPAISCGGEMNIPDGEVFTAPVKDSVEGYIYYNAPTIYHGISFDGIRLEFRKGKIIKATSNSNEKELNKILRTDDGASYIGEFALGFNPYIKRAMRDILFDEKICGSFHFTPGQAYDEADNGNRSKIHWDMVAIQTKEFGGGEIFFDGSLIRKDGLFVAKNLKKLNPEYLLK